LSATELLGLCCTEDSQVELLSDLKHALQKMARIVVKTKVTGQLMGSKLKRRDIVQVVKRVVKRVSSLYPELNITTSIGMTEAHVRADDLLEHLLSNLLENAYEHNPSAEKHAWVTVMSESTGYELRVADNGPGIPEDIRVGLLQPSLRRAGLGLHMSWHIAQKYGGKLQIEDHAAGNVAQGAEVVVWLPAAVRNE
jgi:K+-sensing histidine kinase KdpD